MGFTNGVPIKLIKRLNEIEIDSHYYDNTIIPSEQEFFEFKLIKDKNNPNQYSEAHIVGLSDLGKSQSKLSIPYKYKYGDETSEMYIPVTQLYYEDNLNNSITNIFENCTNLIHVDVPNSISVIPSACFKGCNNLETISLPKSIKTIDSNAFEGCTNLQNVYINYNVTTIGEDIFKNCGDNLSVICYKYSVVERYCKANNIKYSLLSYNLDSDIEKDSEDLVTSGTIWTNIQKVIKRITDHINNKSNPHDNSTFRNAKLTGTSIIEQGILNNLISASEEDDDVKALINIKKTELQSSIPDWDVENSEGNSLYNKELNDYIETILRDKNNKSIINRGYIDNIVNPQEGAGYQTKIDNNLNTDSKTITGAINEVSERINTCKTNLVSGWNTVSINQLYPINWRFFSKPYCYDKNGNTVDFRIRNYQNNVQNNKHCFEIYVPIDCTIDFATTKEDDISGYDVKYIVLTYYYTGVDGKDLDTVTEISNNNWNLNRTVGYGHSSSIKNNGISLVEFGGDNTGGGTGSVSDRYYESIYLNIDEIQNELPDEDIEIILYATWFSKVDKGNINITLSCYTCDKTPIITKSNKLITLSSPDSSSILTKTYENNSEMRCNIPTLKGGASNYKTKYTPAFKITLKKGTSSYRVISIKALS